MAQTFPQPQSPLTPPREGDTSFAADFGGATSALPQARSVSPQAQPSPQPSGGGGFNVGSAVGLGGSALGALGKFTGNPALSAAGTGVGIASRLAGLARPGGMSIGSGLGAGGAILGGLAQLLGDKGLSELANAVGGVGQLVELVGPMASAAASGNAAAMQAATAAAAAAAPAAVVAAVVQMGIALGSGIAAGNPPGQITLDTLAAPDFIASTIMRNFIDPMFHPSEDWMKFPGKVGETAKLEASSLQALAKGLPNVQSKQELADALTAFRSEVGSRVGGYGEGAGPYKISNLPGVGPKTHGMNTRETDFGPFQTQVQSVIDALLPSLPDTYAAPAGDNPPMRNFAQFQDPGYATPQVTYDPGQFGEHAYGYKQSFGTESPLLGGQQMTPGVYGAETYGTVRPGQPGYNYSLPGAYPDPNAPVGAPSSYWQQLIAQSVNPPPSEITAPGTATFQPGTIGRTGGLRTGIGQPAGGFAGQRSPLGGATGATVNPNITQGVAGSTGFVPGKV